VTEHYRCPCGAMVEGEAYGHPRWGRSIDRLRFACQCGRVVYGYTGEQAAREAAREVEDAEADSVGCEGRKGVMDAVEYGDRCPSHREHGHRSV
jgi:hypothetical protein